MFYIPLSNTGCLFKVEVMISSPAWRHNSECYLSQFGRLLVSRPLYPPRHVSLCHSETHLLDSRPRSRILSTIICDQGSAFNFLFDTTAAFLLLSSQPSSTFWSRSTCIPGTEVYLPPSIIAGSAIFIIGILPETVAEVQRKWFKGRPENKGKVRTTEFGG